jgi:aminoglycoside phosphotransferase family enzyme
MQYPAEAEIGAKVAFLARADSYPDGTDAVKVIETHFAWVFLCRGFAYKLKKPIRAHGFDLEALAARRANCELEVSLNRRLAESVYVGVVPLVRSGRSFRLGACGEPAEWLVKMRRLPEERALDRAASSGAVGDADLIEVVDKLVVFYARSARALWTGARYREHLSSTIERCARDLMSSDLRIDTDRVHRLRAGQLRFVLEHETLLDSRVTARRVVDAHGDLRPEHVFLGDPPEIIDCLEFSAELRLLDTAEEIAFLELECERLGFAHIGARIMEIYRAASADQMPPELLAFYRSLRALVRALLAAWRLRDPLTDGDAQHWRRRVAWYLDAAQAALARSQAPASCAQGA